jgi:signal transduction histidine kinase
MFDSLRARLLLWYTAILAMVIAVFATTVCVLAWRTRVADVDAQLIDRAEDLARTMQPTIGGTFDLEFPSVIDPATDGVEGIVPYYALWNAAGERIDSPNPDIAVPMPAGPGVWTRDGSREVAVIATSDALVLAGRPLDDVWSEIVSLAIMIGSVGLGALALSLAGGWWLVGRALQPVDRISRTAKAMVGGAFDARIPIDSVETELGQLARSLNEAFDQLNASIDRQRRFTADASHELRTPLATVSTEAQWALNRERTVDEYRHSIDVCSRAAQRMTGVVERLLMMARGEAGVTDESLEVQLDEVVRRVTEDVASLARARGVSVTVQTTPAAVKGDPGRLLEAVTNVVSNAVQYNAGGGTVDVALTAADAQATLTVKDTGIGIPAEDLAKVFEPFYRADSARSRDVGGAGLGLAVSRAIVEQHQGRISCESETGVGTTVTIVLPTLA